MNMMNMIYTVAILPTKKSLFTLTREGIFNFIDP